MSGCKTALRVTAPVAGTAFFGSLGAATGAFAGTIGAEILDASGYSGYHAIEAAQMGAVGGAVINGAAGFIAGSLVACGLFSTPEKEKKTFTQEAVAYTSGTVIAGLTGYGIMNYGHHETIMELGQTAAAFAVGGAVTMIPVTCALICIAAPIVLAAVVLAENEENTQAASPIEHALSRV